MPKFQLIIHLVIVVLLLTSYLVLTFTGHDGSKLLQLLIGYLLARGVDLGSVQYRNRTGEK